MIYIKKINNEIKAYSVQIENSIKITEEQWEQSNFGKNCDIINNEFIIIDNLEELKQEKIKQLKANCSDYIYSVYPVHKQLNIINSLNDFTDMDRKKMNLFINNARDICNKKEIKINVCNTKEELDLITIEF